MKKWLLIGAIAGALIIPPLRPTPCWTCIALWTVAGFFFPILWLVSLFLFLNFLFGGIPGRLLRSPESKAKTYVQSADK